MKQIVIALVAAVILASTSNSQATVNTGRTVSTRTPRHNGIFRSGRTPGKTGANAPNSIRATPRAAGPTSGNPGDQGDSNSLLEKKEKR